MRQTIVKDIICVLFITIILLIAVNANAGEKWSYRETTANETLEYSIQVTGETSGVVNMKIVSPDSSQEYDNDMGNGATLRWAMNKNGRIMRGVRQGNSIEFSDELNGKITTESKKIDGDLWIQPIEYGLQWLVRDQDKNKCFFWTISPSDGSIIKLVAKKNGVERITIGDREYDTAKVRLTVSGWKSMFWSVDYWFRESDGLFLKFKGAYGFVGTPETVTELIGKK